MKRFFWLILILAAACAPFNRHDGVRDPGSRHFTIQYSKPWMELNYRRHLVLTKDGPFSQYILVQQRPVDQPFKNTKRKLKKGMLPEEAAQVILDEMVSDRGLMNFQLIENRPEIVNQYEGFRMVFSYKTPEGLLFKSILCGLLQGDWFYSIRYCASEGHYTEGDVTTFEKVLHSFYITDSGSA